MSKQTALEELDSKLERLKAEDFKDKSSAKTFNTLEVLDYLDENWGKLKIVKGNRSVYVQRYYAILRHLDYHFGINYCKKRVQTYLISKGLITPRVVFVLLLALYWIGAIIIEQFCNIRVRLDEVSPLLTTSQKYLYFYPIFMFIIIPVWYIVTLEKEY